MTPEMLSHLGHYIHNEYGYRYRVEKIEIGFAGAIAHVLCPGDGSRFKLAVQPEPGCPYEDSTITFLEDEAR